MVAKQAKEDYKAADAYQQRFRQSIEREVALAHRNTEVALIEDEERKWKREQWMHQRYYNAEPSRRIDHKCKDTRSEEHDVEDDRAYVC